MPIVLRITVKPNARTSSLVETSDGTWRATLRSPPVDGRANKELIELVARQFGCRKADVTISSGAAGRLKLVRVDPKPH